MPEPATLTDHVVVVDYGRVGSGANHILMAKQERAMAMAARLLAGDR